MQKRVSRLFVQNFLFHSTEKFCLGNTSVYQKISGILKFLFIREEEGGYHVSPSKFFVIQYRKISLGNTSVYQKTSGIEKLYTSERGVSLSPSKTFRHTVLKNFVGEHFGVSKKFWYRKFSSKGGGSCRVLSNFFYLTAPIKLRQGTILCFRKFLVGRNNLWIRGAGT